MNRISQFDLYNSQAITTNKHIQVDKELCKICFNAEANMINTKCYHLAVCENVQQNFTNNVLFADLMVESLKKYLKHEIKF